MPLPGFVWREHEWIHRHTANRHRSLRLYYGMYRIPNGLCGSIGIDRPVDGLNN